MFGILVRVSHISPEELKKSDFHVRMKEGFVIMILKCQMLLQKWNLEHIIIFIIISEAVLSP
jgi:hypothetical protein